MNKPKFWEWEYCLARNWAAPKGVDVPKLIGFAIILATFGTEGGNIYPSAATLAERACMTPNTAKKWRGRCVKLGLFRDTGETYHRIPILEIAMPPDAANVTVKWAAESKPRAAVRVTARVPEPVPVSASVAASAAPAAAVEPEPVAAESVDVHICKRDPWAYDDDLTCATCGRVIPALAGGTEVFGEVLKSSRAA